MRQELDLLQMRNEIDIVGTDAQLRAFMPHVELFSSGIRRVVSNAMNLENSPVSRMVEKEKNQPTAYYLASFLISVRGDFLQNVAVGAMSSSDNRMKLIGALVTDMSAGFTEEMVPLVVAHDSSFSATQKLNATRSEAERYIEGAGGGKDALMAVGDAANGAVQDWNKYRRLLSEDTRGFKLLGNLLEEARKEKQSTRGGVRMYELKGVELAFTIYKETYPRANQIVEVAKRKIK